MRPWSYGTPPPFPSRGLVTSDSASRELEGVPFVPAGSEEQSRPLWPCGAPPSTMKLCSAPRRLRRFPHGTKQQARQHDEAVLSCLLLNTERSLRSYSVLPA